MRTSTVATAALVAGSTQVHAAPTFGLIFGLMKGITTAVHSDLNLLLGSVGVGLQTNANVHGQALGFGGVGCPFSLSSQAGVSVNAGLHGGLSHSIGWSAGVNGGAFINWKSFKANGVTLSGWLVQDKSLDLDWWNKYGSDCNDEWSLTAKLGAKAGAVLEARYSSYITTSYIDSLAAAGINLLRIPTHYSAWVSVPGSGLYSGNQQAHLKTICDYAIQRHGMHIVIGLDSLPGGVNGLSSGERIGATGWFNSAENLSYSFKAIDAILGFISASGRVNAFTISPINEPCDITANFATTGGLSIGATNFITTYIQGVVKKIGKLDARIPCMVQDAFLGHDYWAPLFSANANIVIDSHVSFSASASAAPQLSAHLIAPSVCKQTTLLKGTGKFPVFVGSYGIQAQEGNTLSGRKTIYNTQKYAYAQNLSGGCFSHAKAYSNSVTVSGEGCASDYNSFQSLMSANIATKNTESCYC
ncbi:glycoside hydrolase family 5 protein [Aureobasidium namibiae CBS 147.97]|uniref:glucan 1,3-beta-glucosidase n=1 Tax=Aureobasidium namibiae CBS 147.97 TaxID=1043004 RepID=A0A074WEQ8_9PEZI|nr:glycoside hydrolase family 5 protein [Aureobasidium namibiae CBS 147.97]KEQ70029.1 glycoside hydrolase family 5 protein [Aureobasidium namibiae CBS 147.97]